MASQSIARAWSFSSESNPNKLYQTLQYTDGSTSCDCPGWTRRVTADGKRTCKHTRFVDMNQADAMSIEHHDYRMASAKKTQVTIQTPTKHGTQKETAPGIGQRKLILD